MGRSRVAVLAAIVLVALVSMATAAAAETVEIPVDTVIRAEPGSIVQLSQVDIDADLVGSTCEWTVTANNQQSVHPGNDLILATGGAHSVMAGVEDAAGQLSTASNTIVLGPSVTVLLDMGADGVFSGGVTVAVLCPEVSDATEEPPAAAPATEPSEPTSSPADTPLAAPGGDETPTGSRELAATGLSLNIGLLLVATGLLVAGRFLITAGAKLAHKTAT